VKTIKILITGLLLSSTLWAQAQTTESTPALESAPPALMEQASQPQIAAEKANPEPKAFVRKPQFSLDMGSQFSRFGHAAYLQPTLTLPLSPRFQAFASVQFLNTFGPTFYRANSETGTSGLSSRGQQSYVVMAGGNYVVNEKLNITGSLWRDFSRYSGLAPQWVNPFSPAGSQGMMFRAHYKVTNNFSVSGGIRYGNGPGYSGYNPMFYQGYNSPFGL
jgi:hypothetical protein